MNEATSSWTRADPYPGVEKLRDAVEEKGQQPGVVLTQRQRLLFPARVR